jgi:biotin synthase
MGAETPEQIIVTDTRHDWRVDEVGTLFDLPFNDLIFRAQTVHRAHFDPNQVQMSTLLSIKTGGCPEDCAYCPQSAHHEAAVKAERLMQVEAVLAEARQAKAAGATPSVAWSRACAISAWNLASLSAC